MDDMQEESASSDEVNARLTYNTEDLEMARSIYSMLLVQTIESGQVDTAGKTEDQIIHEAQQVLKETFLTEPFERNLATTHLEDLLDQASKFVEQEELDFACLFYATWFEHWVNRLFLNLAVRRGDMLQEDFDNMLRDVGLRGKMTWLLQLFGLESIDRIHRARITALMNRRNEFAHYKWRTYDIDSGFEQERSLADLMEQFKATTIPYLLDYEDRHLYSGMRDRLTQRLRYPKLAPESE
jgi:hypothetical protein